MRLGLLAALVVALLPDSGARAQSGATDPSIVIAVIATLSGPGAIAGQDVVDGVNVALKQLGSRFANQEVRVVLADDKGSADTARLVARRLIERERLDVVLTAVSAPALASILPVLTEARLFVLNIGAVPPGLNGAGCSHWVFDVAASPDGLHEAAGQYFAAEQVRRLVVVGSATPATATAVTALKHTFPGEVAAVITPHHGAATFDAELARLVEMKPDAVYSVLTGGMGVAFLRAFDAAGLRPEIAFTAASPGFERLLLPAMGDAALDVVTVGSWSPDLDNPANRRFQLDFELEQGRPATTWAAQGFDAVQLLDGALKTTQGRTTDSEAVRAGLRKAEFNSVRGSFRFSTNHVPVVNYYVRRVVRDAKGRLTHELKGLVLKDWRDRSAAACPMRWEEVVPPPPAKAVKKP